MTIIHLSLLLIWCYPANAHDQSAAQHMVAAKAQQDLISLGERSTTPSSTAACKTEEEAHQKLKETLEGRVTALNSAMQKCQYRNCTPQENQEFDKALQQILTTIATALPVYPHTIPGTIEETTSPLECSVSCKDQLTALYQWYFALPPQMTIPIHLLPPTAVQHEPLRITIDLNNRTPYIKLASTAALQNSPLTTETLIYLYMRVAGHFKNGDLMHMPAPSISLSHKRQIRYCSAFPFWEKYEELPRECIPPAHTYRLPYKVPFMYPGLVEYCDRDRMSNRFLMRYIARCQAYAANDRAGKSSWIACKGGILFNIQSIMNTFSLHSDAMIETLPLDNQPSADKRLLQFLEIAMRTHKIQPATLKDIIHKRLQTLSKPNPFVWLRGAYLNAFGLTMELLEEACKNVNVPYEA